MAERAYLRTATISIAATRSEYSARTTVRREYLDRLLFWTAADLERKLVEFQQYYNEHRTHAGRAGRPPAPNLDPAGARASLWAYRWQPHCRGLYHTPRAA